MKEESNTLSPISIRLTQDEADELKEIGGGKSVAAGVKVLLQMYKVKEISQGTVEIDEFKALEEEVKGLKNSPFGFDKKEIVMLERELEKAKEKYKKIKSESLKERILGLVKSVS